MPRRTKDPAAEAIAYFATAPLDEAQKTMQVIYSVIAKRAVDDPMRPPRLRKPKSEKEPAP